METVTTIAAVRAHVRAWRAAGLPSNGVQGMVIERGALEELVARLAALPARERASVPGIKPARADLILAGALVVHAVLLGSGLQPQIQRRMNSTNHRNEMGYKRHLNRTAGGGAKLLLDLRKMAVPGQTVRAKVIEHLGRQ